MNVCPCGTETAATFCRPCGDELVDNFRAVPELHRELETTLARQRGIDYAAMGESHSTKPDAAPLPVHAGAMEARTRLSAAAHAVTGGRVTPETAHALNRAVQHALRVIDTPPPRWFAGPCGECGRDLYARMREGTITCPCGETYDVGDRRAELLADAEHRVADTPTIARAVSWLGEKPVTSDRIRQWASRGKLTQQYAVNGRPRYRIGDVLDLLHAQGGKKV